ncbi:hypothetical protein JCM8097_005140 [Rhodosporidiobolus ruineniae]
MSFQPASPPSSSSSTPLFFSPSPRPKAPLPSTSPTTPSSLASTPRRRTPLSVHPTSDGAGKGSRSPASRAWNRRLSFSSAPSSSAPSTSASTGASGAATPQQDGGMFSFAPVASSSSSASSSAFDLSGMAMEVDEIGQVEQPPLQGNVTPRSMRRLTPRKTVGLKGERKKRVKTGINDLPDELLLRIFSFLNDQQGFRPLPGRSSITPEWYTPPLRIALVCQRWLPIAQHLFYRYVKISHLKRIPSLHHTFSTTDLALSVRHLSIELPFSAIEKLGVPYPLPPGQSPLGGSGEADSDLDPASRSTSGRTTPVHCQASEYSQTPTKSSKKQKRPLLPQDELRAVFQACSKLLSLEISGVAPSTLFGSSSSSKSSTVESPGLPSPPPSPSALQHLHLLRLSTVTSLTLKSLPTHGDVDDPSHLTSLALRDALLALTGLTSLTLKGYVSSTSSSPSAPGPLNFAPTRTVSGLAARPLPSRARTRALLPLARLSLVDCAMSPSDLLALLRQIQPGKLRTLSIDEAFQPSLARGRRNRGRWDRPTVEGLNSPGVVELVEGSLTRLRVTLHNYPVVSGFAPAVVTSPSTSPPPSSSSSALGLGLVSSPPRSRRRRPSSNNNRSDSPTLHILDGFIARLDQLQSLDVGGSVVTSDLFLPPPPPPPPGSAPHDDPPPPALPRALKSLTLRSCEGITPQSLQPLLLALAPSPSPSASSSPSPLAADTPLPHLRRLSIHGSTEYGWASPSLCATTQLLCWNAGVEWVSGSTGGGRGAVSVLEGGVPDKESRDGGSWRAIAPSSPPRTRPPAFSPRFAVGGTAATQSTGGSDGGAEAGGSGTGPREAPPDQWVTMGLRAQRASGGW